MIAPPTAGPPHSRSTSLKGGGPVSTEPTLKANGVASMTAKDRVYPHIDDLTHGRPDIDKRASIKKLIEDGEAAAKAAETMHDFQRYDLAYQDHIKATWIVAEGIGKHPDFPSLQVNDQLLRARNGLAKRVHLQNSKWNPALINIIKENNAKHGTVSQKQRAQTVFPSVPKELPNGNGKSYSAQANRTSSAGSGAVKNGNLTNGTSSKGSEVRPKPPSIPPKPETLHGKAISPTSSAHGDDLNARLARLRTPTSPAVKISPVQASPVQDPRIRTQLIPLAEKPQPTPKSPPLSQTVKFSTPTRPLATPDKPLIPRTTPRPDLGTLDTGVPPMPRAPEPIYSPSQTDGSSNLPSSNSRKPSYAGHARKNSAAPVSSVGPTPGVVEAKPDYFSYAQTPISNGYSQDVSAKKERDFDIPNTSTISAQELTGYRNRAAERLRILFVDVRTRAEFDKGHIMSQSIICIEPITLRRAISAGEIEDSLVLSPESEQELYKKRNEFDLVVFYDQNSSQTSTAISNGVRYLDEFSRALFEHGFDKATKHRPKLLVGGLDAWVDLMGSGSLQTAAMGTTSIASTTSPTKTPREPPRITTLEDLKKNAAKSRTKAAQKGRPTSKGRDSESDTSSTTLQAQSPSDFSHFKDQEDFLRRYPDVPTQESMISDPPSQSLPIYNREQNAYVPVHPARPAPTVPRSRSSGISERGPTAYTMSVGSGPGFQGSGTAATPGLVGLGSRGVQCYVNSVTQCLSATTRFRDFFLRSQFPALPTWPGEKAIKQEVCQQLHTVFYFMWSGDVKIVTPSQFWSCINSLQAARAGPSANYNYLTDGICGRSVQHDVQETYILFLDLLKDELNINRTIPQPLNLTDQERETLSRRPPFASAMEQWQCSRVNDSSVISDMFEGQRVYSTICDTCGYVSRQWQPFTELELPFPADRRGECPEKITLPEILDHAFANPDTKEMRCVRGACKDADHEKGGGEGRRHTTHARISYWPEYLVCYFGRFTNDLVKIQTKIPFSESDISLTKYAFTGGEPLPENAASLPPNVKGPFKYRPYAAIFHSGSGIKSGHYIAMARHLDKVGEQGKWHTFNDNRVNFVAQPQNVQGDLVMLFLRRI